MTSRPSTAAPILAVLAIVLVMLAAYVGGYFWSGERADWQVADAKGGVYVVASGQPDKIERSYRNPWLAIFFKPAGFVEGRIRGVDVQTTYELEPFDSGDE